MFLTKSVKITIKRIFVRKLYLTFIRNRKIKNRSPEKFSFGPSIFICTYLYPSGRLRTSIGYKKTREMPLCHSPFSSSKSIRAQPVTTIKLSLWAVRKGHRGSSAAIMSAGGKMIDTAFFSRFVFPIRLHNARAVRPNVICENTCCVMKAPGAKKTRNGDETINFGSFPRGGACSVTFWPYFVAVNSFDTVHARWFVSDATDRRRLLPFLYYHTPHDSAYNHRGFFFF